MLRKQPQQNKQRHNNNNTTTKSTKRQLHKSTRVKSSLVTKSSKRRLSTTTSLNTNPQSTLTNNHSGDPFHIPERYELPSGQAETTNDLRSSFLNYFKSQGHEHLPSASVVPTTDPTLLFTSAGMVPFKNVFLGVEKPPNGKTRITTAQRCVRAGGKHNDLDNVGYTARHHTFFEMLGNFSFGDYFKEEAIYYAWDYLTNHVKLPKNKLMVSVFETDDEAAKLWSKISGFSETNGTIRRMGAEDNFWQMGDTGPCGPCSEIYFDQGFEVDGEQFLEIWNLVFMQFNRSDDGLMNPLDKKCVDTGMGLERLAAVMQGVRNNYDNDTFLSLVNKVGSTAQFHNHFSTPYDHHHHQKQQHPNILGPNGESLTNNDNTSPPTTTSTSSQSTNVDLSTTPITHEQRITATRVITDHLRSILAMLYDGVQPGSTGRGYVLRRILRRACRYGLNLGYTAPFMYQHVDDVLKAMEPAIPGITQHSKQLRADLFREEKIFSSSLNKGVKIIKDFVTKNALASDLTQPLDNDNNNNNNNNNNTTTTTPTTIKKPLKQFPVDLAFSLYDAHGFPIDLTELCVQEYGYTLDTQAVEKLLQKRREESRDSSKLQLASMQNNASGNSADSEILTQKIIDSLFEMWRNDGLTSEFVGYEKTFVPQARVLDIQPLGAMKRLTTNDNNNNNNNNDNQVDGIPPSLGKRKVMLTLDQCPFYPTGGGQTSDTGSIVIRIPKAKLSPEAQGLTMHDFETITIDVTNAIRDPSGQMILLVAEFDENQIINSDEVLEMIKNDENDKQSGAIDSTTPWKKLFISASVDSDLRSQTSIHHTATHLLQASLQRVLGEAVNEIGDHHHHHHHHEHEHDHTNNDNSTNGNQATIKQAGSSVEHRNLRFDFGFQRPLTSEEINAVEDRVNAIALRRIPVNISEMSFNEAKKLGAMALFGEKYGSEVRVVEIPDAPHTHQLEPIPTQPSNNEPINTNVDSTRRINKPKNFSVELCGGTHVDNTSSIYPFVILSENGVSSGTRRIEAIAGPMAAQHLAEQHRMLKILKVDQVLKLHHLAPTDEIISNVIKLKTKSDTSTTKIKELEKEKLSILTGKKNQNGNNNQNGQEMQDINPLLSSFWHQPNGIDLSICLPTLELGSNDQGQLNSRAPIVMLYGVSTSLSGDYSIYRKFTEDLFLQQSTKHAQFMSAQGFSSHQSIAHVFIGEENGKVMIYSNIPESCTKKGGAEIISGHGGKHLASNDVWKSISAILKKSKGGGNMSLAQGTFDFTDAKSSIEGAEAKMMNGSSSANRLQGLNDALVPMLTQSCKF